MKIQMNANLNRKCLTLVGVFILTFAGVATFLTASAADASGGIDSVAAHLPTFSAGADVSHFGYIEQNGGIYQLAGKQLPLPEIFKRAGCNTLRLMLWHNSSIKERARRGIYGTLDTIDYTLPLAVQIKHDGFNLVLDMHLSDTWADPGRQSTPYDWKGLSYGALRHKVYDYTKQVMMRFRAAHAMPMIVMVGNEINNGILWPVGKLHWHNASSWIHFFGLLKSAIAGVNAGSGSRQPQIMLQVGNFNSPQPLVEFFSKLVAQGVKFDVIGYDYYPYWGGATDHLRSNLLALATTINKPIIVAETAYPWSSNIYNKSWENKPGMTYQFSPQGQNGYISHVISIVKALPNGLGRGVWWWGAEFNSDQRSFVHDPWSYRSLFDHRGNALPALTTLCSAAVP